VGIYIKAHKLAKTFNRRVIFRNISFSLREQQVLRIIGKNGSGKSTLVKIIGHVLAATEGTVDILSGDGKIKAKNPLMLIGLVSPYLQMYDEFTAWENLSFGFSIRGLKPNGPTIERMLQTVSLFNRRNDQVRTYSSGMKQRLKYAFALVHEPPILLLDEPMENLDAEGTRIVRKIMVDQHQRGVLIVATNDIRDLKTFDLQVELDEIV
jgi:heme exporter protein A